MTRAERGAIPSEHEGVPCGYTLGGQLGALLKLAMPSSRAKWLSWEFVGERSYSVDLRNPVVRYVTPANGDPYAGLFQWLGTSGVAACGALTMIRAGDVARTVGEPPRPLHRHR
jgi:hypothetical protein